MPRHLVRLVYLCLGLTVLLSSCGFREGPPRLEPVEFGGTGSGVAFGTVVMVSTNCAEVGEWVTFEFILENNSDTSATISGSPPLDIVIEPAQWDLPEPQPIERWSESYQYPQEIDLSFEPGERQSYTWKWQANTQFTQQGMHASMVRISLIRNEVLFGNGNGRPTTDDFSFMGIGWYADDRGAWACTDMPR